MAKKVRDVKLPDTRSYTTLNDIHTIMAWYQDTEDKIRLTPSQEEFRDKVDFTDNLIRKYGGRSQVVPILMKHFEIKKRNAEELYNYTQTMLNSMPRATKDYWRDIATDWASQYRDRAILKGNLKAEGDAIKILMKTRMLDQEDIQDKPVEMPPQTIIIELQANSLGLVALTEDEAAKLLKEVMKPKRKANFMDDPEEVEYTDERNEDNPI